jgi:hypothetical protein
MSSTKIPITSPVTPAPHSSGERKNRLALLRVCRQIHEETALLPFSLNEFCFFYGNGFRDLCLAIGPIKRHAIRKLRLDDKIMHAMTFTVDMRRDHGFDSLSQLLSSIRRVHVAANTILNQCLPKLWPNLRARYQRILEDWVRVGLKDDVDVKIEFRSLHQAL